MFLKNFLTKTDKSLELTPGSQGLSSENGAALSRLRASSRLLALEPRVMFDGAGLLTADAVVDRIAEPTATVVSRVASNETAPPQEARLAPRLVNQEVSRQEVSKLEGLLAADNQPAASGSPSQLLVIDTGVADWQSLITGLPGDVNVLVLDPALNALSQIAERAQSLGTISALHVISHGESAKLSLAGADIDAAELIRSQSALLAIGQAMTADGDILLYGCDVAQGSSGAAFIALIAHYTQADVAASTNETGAKGLGGDWKLEAQTGSVETKLVVSEAVQLSFSHVLGPPPVLDVQKGVVRDNDATLPITGVPTRQFLIDDTTTVSAETSLVTQAGSAVANPIAGIVNAGNRSLLNTDEINVDGGDTVRYAIVVTNTVNSDSNAFDIKLLDDLPPGVNPSAVTNLRVTMGDGTVVYDGTLATQPNLVRADNGGALADEAAVIAALFTFGQGIELVDPSGSVGRLQGGADAFGAANTSGSNVLIVTYDITIDASNTNVSEAGKTLTSSATVAGYASADAGANLIASTPISEEASISIASATIAKRVIDTNQTHTIGTDVVVGEVVTYQVTIVIPEGVHTPVNFHDCLDDEQTSGALSGTRLAGMSILGVDSIFFSAGLSSSNGNDLATLDGNGALVVGDVVIAGGATYQNRALNIDFGTLTNSNNDNSVRETITVTYRALVLNRPLNQEGQLLLNFAEVKIDNVQQALATDGVLVREPVWTITVTPDNAQADAGDAVNFTVLITGGGPVEGFNGNLDPMVLPAGLTYVGGSFVFDGAASTGQVNGAITANAGNLSAAITALKPGETAVFHFSATIDNTAVLAQNFVVPGLVRWSSLPNTPDDVGTLSPGSLNPTIPALTETTVDGLQQDSERTGAQGVGGNLNDYAATDTGSVAITPAQVTLTIVQTSEPNTQANTGDAANPGAAENIPVAIGEVVRYRALVRLPEAMANDAGIRVALPNGLRFLNDGAITYALVSDGGLSSSTLSAPSGLVADGGAPINPQDLAAIRPSTLLPGSAIARVGGGSVFASGDDVIFNLGKLSNADSDADAEWVLVEFNAVVENQFSNQDALSNNRNTAALALATALDTNFDFVTDVSTTSDLRGRSDTDTVTVREPAIVNLAKTVIETTGSLATFELSFSNTGSEEAYNVRLVDDFTAATNINGSSLAGVSITSVATVVNNSSVSALDLAIARLDPGQTVTVRFTVSVTDLSQPLPPKQAQVTYSGLSASGANLIVADSGGPIAGVPISSPGVTRNGLSFVGDTAALNNYVDQVAAGSGVIAGRLWDDTNQPGRPGSANNVYDPGAGGDQPLANITVRLVWVGPGPMPAGFPIDVTTDADGKYCFAGLPPGNYQVIIPSATLTSPTDGPLQQRYESDGTVNRSISVSLPDGQKLDGNDFAYVQINRAPTVTVPSNTLSINEDDTLCFDGGTGTTAGVTHVGLVSIGDPNARDPGNQTLVITSTNGVLDVGPLGASNNGLINGVTVSGDQTAALTLTGTRAEINALLQTLCYKPTAHYFGPAQMTLSVNDRGNGGDIPSGNGVPFEAVNDNLTATQVINLTVINLSNPPTAPNEIFTLPRTITLTSPEAKLAAVIGPTDPDLPTDTLQVQILGLPTSLQGQFYKAGPNGPVLVAVGDLLTPSQLQQLCFVPNPAVNATPNPDGTIPAGTLSYKVTDATGATALGSISIKVPPTAPALPPQFVPRGPLPPPGGPFAPNPGPTPLSNVLRETSFARIADEVRVEQLLDRSHFDPFNLLAVKNSEIIVDRVEKPTVGKASAEKPAKEEDDCAPAKPKVKIKPKAVKRFLVEDKLGLKEKNFSEQLNAEKKRFRAPVKLKAKAAPEQVC